MNQQLHDELLPAVRRAFTEFVKAHAADRVYGVNLYTSGEYNYLVDSVLTVGGLRSVAEKYLEEDSYQEEWGTIENAMNELKWNAPDSPWHCEQAHHFCKIDALLGDFWANAEDDSLMSSCRQVHETAVAVLKAIRNEGIFIGDGIVFNVVTGDQSNEERYLNAEELNPPDVLANLKKELAVNDNELKSLRKNRWTD